MKATINKSIILEGVLNNIRNQINQTELTANLSSQPAPVNAIQASVEGNRNIFMGQKASDNYSGQQLVREAKHSLNPNK